MPHIYIQDVLRKFHDESLHPGIGKMQAMLGNLMTWRGMMKHVRTYVRSCHKCQIAKPKAKKFAAPWKSVLPAGRGDVLAVDLLGRLVRSVYGYMWILVMVDVFTKFVKLYGLRRSTADACLNKIKKCVRTYGIPKKVLSDKGSQLQSNTWKLGLRRLGIRSIHTAIRNPRGNPSERYVKIVGECIRINCMNKHESWATHLGKIEDFINGQYNSMTGELPVELQCRCRCPLELERYLMYPKLGKPRNWQEVERAAKMRLEHQSKLRNKYCDNKVIEFQIGQLVLVRNDQVSNASKKISAKLNPLYVGPLEILKKLSESTYVIGMKGKPGSEKIHNIRYLHPYIARYQQTVGAMIIPIRKINLFPRRDENVATKRGIGNCDVIRDHGDDGDSDNEGWRSLKEKWKEKANVGVMS